MGDVVKFGILQNACLYRARADLPPEPAVIIRIYNKGHHVDLLVDGRKLNSVWLWRPETNWPRPTRLEYAELMEREGEMNG